MDIIFLFIQSLLERVPFWDLLSTYIVASEFDLYSVSNELRVEALSWSPNGGLAIASVTMAEKMSLWKSKLHIGKSSMVKKQTTHRKIIDGVLCPWDQKSQIRSVTLTSSTRRDSSDWYECYIYHSSMYNEIRRAMTYMVIKFLFISRGKLMASYHPSDKQRRTQASSWATLFFFFYSLDRLTVIPPGPSLRPRGDEIPMTGLIGANDTPVDEEGL